MSNKSGIQGSEKNPEEETPHQVSVSFPSNVAVTYQKIKDTIMKFVELGGGPFTQDQIKERMSDLGNIDVVVDRVLPYTHYLGFMDRSRIGKGGPVTYKLKPELRERLEKDVNEFDPIFIELCKRSPAYRVIWTYSAEEKTSKFLANAFEQSYLRNRLGLKFSSSGFSSFLNALDKVKLLVLSGGFISLEGIISPLAAPQAATGTASGAAKQVSGATVSTTPASSEGVAPSMTLNVNVNLDYRQPPDLQREYMEWLERMAAKPNVMVSIRRQEEKKAESKSAKEID